MVISILEIGRMVKLMEKVYLLKQMDHFIRVHGNKTNSTEKEKKFKKEEILFMKVILLKVKNKEKENQFLVKTFMKVISKMICFMVKASTQWQTQVVFMKANLKIIYSMETENLPTLTVALTRANFLKERWKAKAKLFCQTVTSGKVSSKTTFSMAQDY